MTISDVYVEKDDSVYYEGLYLNYTYKNHYFIYTMHISKTQRGMWRYWFGILGGDITFSTFNVR